MRLRLQTRLALGYGVAIASLATVLVLVFLLFQAVRAESAFVREEALPRIEAANRLLLAVEEMENAEFRYFLDPTRIEPWRTTFDASAMEFREAYEQLETLSHTPEDRSLLTVIGQRMGGYLHVDERMRRLVANDDVAEARRLNRTESLVAAQEVRQAAREFRARSQRAVLAAQAREERYFVWTERLGFLVAIIGLMLAGISWLRTSRALGQPLAALEAAMARMGRGHFEGLEPDPVAERTAEIAALHAGFNHMAGRLTTLTSDLHQAANTLEVQVAERTLDLREANVALARNVEDLKALDAMKNNFMAIMSHELLTPINFVMGYGSALEDGVLGELTPAQRDAVAKMLSGAERLTRMVRNVLDFTRLEAGTLVVVEAPTDARAVAEAAVREVEGAIAAKEQVLTVEVAPALPPVLADADRLRQVLTELLDNAVKFTSARGKVTLEVAHAENGVVFAVKDTGIGIAPEALPELCRPFTQADFTATRRYGGMGLGLAIASGLLAHMGSRLEARSQLGSGSTFSFELKRAAAARSAAK